MFEIHSDRKECRVCGPKKPEIPIFDAENDLMATLSNISYTET